MTAPAHPQLRLVLPSDRQPVTTTPAPDALPPGVRPVKTTRDLVRWLAQVAESESRTVPLRVGIILVEHAARGELNPKQADLAARLGVSRRSVQYALEHLRDDEHVRIKSTGGQGIPSSYILLLKEAV